MRYSRLWLCYGTALAIAACGGSASSPPDDGSSGADAPPAEISGTDATAADEGIDGGVAPPYEGYVSEQYGGPGNWLCHPAIADGPCRINLDATIVHPDGTTELEPYAPAADP
ncbi:MAG: hypothetical protein GY856_33960, partial [bacterium]|nr:hypothetical protein [bacterium]